MERQKKKMWPVAAEPKDGRPQLFPALTVMFEAPLKERPLKTAVFICSSRVSDGGDISDPEKQEADDTEQISQKSNRV